jgi:hypothetical protein
MTWKGLNQAAGVTGVIDSLMRSLPHDLICSLDGAQHVHVFSDYSGGYRGSDYLTYSFLLADLHRSQAALRSLTAVRGCLGSRRMGYKSLGDRWRLAVLPEFLEGASRIHGHVFTIAVSKTARSLFGPRDDSEADPDLSAIANRYKAQEHMGRILHFVSMAIAGFTSAGQHLDWITDVDDIAPEQDWLEGLVTLVANVSSHHLRHSLGNLRVGTTRSDDGSLMLEDLCAVPDLFAGAIAESLSHQSCDSLSLPEGLIVPLAPTVKGKAVGVLARLTNADSGSLRSTCICIEPQPSGGLRIQLRCFHEMPTLA